MPEQSVPIDLQSFIREQRDRHEIHECVLRYARGIDRHDRELALSAYHQDGYDEHIVIEALAPEFIDWANQFHATNFERHQHFILNHLADIDGDTAHAETYYVAVLENLDGTVAVSTGRYIDRFERRDGRWAIAHRVCVGEMRGSWDKATARPATGSSPFALDAASALYRRSEPKRDRSDISYMRPLA